MESLRHEQSEIKNKKNLQKTGIWLRDFTLYMSIERGGGGWEDVEDIKIQVNVAKVADRAHLVEC